MGSVGSFGYHWSSSPNSATKGYYLSFTSGVVTSSIYYYRANGFPVRCVKE